MANSLTTPISFDGSGEGTLGTGNLVVSTAYRIQSTSGACVSYSDAYIITVTPVAKAGSVSTPTTTVCLGGEITFSLIGAVGTSYQWQTSASNSTAVGSIWNNVGTSTTYQATASSLSKLYVRCVVSNSCTSATSAVKTILVDKPSVAGAITGGGIVCSDALSTIKLSGFTGLIQWEFSIDGVNYAAVPYLRSGVYLNPSGATTFETTTSTGKAASYIVTNLTANTYFRAKITSGQCSSVYSLPVLYQKGTVATAGTVSASSSNICSGSSTTLTLTGNSSGLIAWYKSVNATSTTPTWTLVSGQITNTLTSGLLTVTTWYKAIVTSGSCIDETPIVQVTVNSTSVVRSITGTGTICSGSTRLLTLGVGSVGALQWYSSTTSATANDFSPISGATGETYLASPTATTWYRVVATSGVCSSITSAAVVVTVNQPAAVGTITATTPTICTATATTITLSSAQGTIAWQRATVTNGIPDAFVTITGTTASLSTGSLTGSRAYRAVVTSGVCTLKATSNVEIVTVIPAAKVAAITGFNTATTKACVGTPKTLTLGTGYVGTIEWLSSPTLTGTYTVIPGETATTYVYTPSVAGVMYFKVRTTSSPCSVQAITATGIAVHADTTNCTRQAAVIETNEFNVIAYPNPSSDEFTIEASGKGNIEVQVYDMQGRLVENTHSTQIGSKLAAGTYNVIVNQGTNTKTLRVIKK